MAIAAIDAVATDVTFMTELNWLLAGDMGVRVTGNASATGEDDWYKITTTAADMGKRIHVRSYSLAYIWFDAEIVNPDGMSFASYSIANITLDFYSPPITVPGEYAIHFQGDYTGNHDIVISVQ